jgi:hypothetical protein
MTEAPPIAPSAPDAAPDWDAYRKRGFVRLVELLLRPPPEALAAGKGLLTRAERRAVADWLRPLEQLVRMLLVWTVLLMPGAAGARRAPPRRPRRPSRRERVACGRASAGFQLWTASSGPSGTAPPDGGEPLISAWRLVERLEAVLGVIEDPAPSLDRLARRWGRRGPGRGAGRTPSGGPARSTTPRSATPRPGVSAFARPWLVAEARELMARVAALDTG